MGSPASTRPRLLAADRRQTRAGRKQTADSGQQTANSPEQTASWGPRCQTGGGQSGGRNWVGTQIDLHQTGGINFSPEAA